MNSEPAPNRFHQRCPRCDQVLTVIDIDQSRGLMLACPELYCDYVWAPSPRELKRLTKDQGEPDDSIKRAAG
jgi:hypothetical protein